MENTPLLLVVVALRGTPPGPVNVTVAEIGPGGSKLLVLVVLEPAAPLPNDPRFGGNTDLAGVDGKIGGDEEGIGGLGNACEEN
jgi:hypothetical protein